METKFGVQTLVSAQLFVFLLIATPKDRSFLQYVDSGVNQEICFWT